MFVDFGGVHLLLLTAVVLAGAQVTKVPLPAESRGDRNIKQNGSYQTPNSYSSGLVDTHNNFKPRKDLSSSSDHNNEVALGDDAWEFSAQDEKIFDNEETFENGSPSATAGAGGAVGKGAQFNLRFNYTIDVSDMSLACRDGRVNFTDSARQLVLALNRTLRMFPTLRDKYAKWAYDASWQDYVNLIQEDLDARLVPLLPRLPEDFNHAIIKLKKPTTPESILLPDWIREILFGVTSQDAVKSLDRVLQDTYSAVELCKAATDLVLLEQALSSDPLMSELTELNERLERVLGILWNVLAKCNIDPNPEPLQHILHILELTYARETVDDIKRRGFLTIYHTERVLDYVKHILKQIDPYLSKHSE